MLFPAGYMSKTGTMRTKRAWCDGLRLEGPWFVAFAVKTCGFGGAVLSLFQTRGVLKRTEVCDNHGSDKNGIYLQMASEISSVKCARLPYHCFALPGIIVLL